MDFYNIFIQFIGIVGFVFFAISFQYKDKKKILLMQLLSSIFFSVHLYLLGAISGAVINVIVSFRSYIYYKKDNYKWANSTAWLYIFVGLFSIAGVFTYNRWYSVIPAFNMITNSFSTWYGKGKTIRIVGLLIAPLWFMYDYNVNSIPGMINDVFMTTSIIVGMLRHDINYKKIRKLES